MSQSTRLLRLLPAVLVSAPLFVAAADRIAATGGDIVLTPIIHSSVQIEYAGTVVQIDPWSVANLSPAKPADLILVTDTPTHHLDPKAIERLRKPGAPVLLPPTAQERFASGTALAYGETKTVAGIVVEAIPAYDLENKPGQAFHPKGKGNGYLLTIGGKRIYFTGVTECVPEIRALKNIDVAFISMNLPADRMTPALAAECAKAIKPKVAYFYHYDQDYAAKLENANAKPITNMDASQIAESLTALKAAMRGEPIELRMPAWYPPIAAK
jgi:L-ascorbate metabolism protein UlaG (beta-lactamase superfamily)